MTRRRRRLSRATRRFYDAGGVRVLALVAAVAGVWDASAAAGTALRDSPRLAVKVIEVRGVSALATDEVVRAGRLRIGESLLGMKTGRVRQGIQSLPLVPEARVERRLPGTVRILVKERTPVARLDDGRGVAVDGVAFDYPASRLASLPIAGGEDAARILGDVPPAWRARLKRVDGGKDGVKLELADGTHVALGAMPGDGSAGAATLLVSLDRLDRVLSDLSRRGLGAESILLPTDGGPGTVRPISAAGLAGSSLRLRLQRKRPPAARGPRI